jgi:NhaP-type Na+/H+ or K+/H+ antiporter
MRGIGSLTYLMYAIQNVLPETLVLKFINFTLVVTLSILLHGISIKLLTQKFWQKRLIAARTILLRKK